MCKVSSFFITHIWTFHLSIFFIFALATTALTLEQLGDTVTSDYDGTPPLYITKIRKNTENSVYVNNALIVRSNIQTVKEDGKKQVRRTYVLRTLWFITRKNQSSNAMKTQNLLWIKKIFSLRSYDAIIWHIMYILFHIFPIFHNFHICIMFSYIFPYELD